MIERSEFALNLAKQTIYMMGISFVLGSLFTIFILMVLEMVKRSRLHGEYAEEEFEEVEG